MQSELRERSRPSGENMESRESRLTVFTVFTPTFNRARTLPRVYESLRAQTFRDFEWLIVDDGSTDETPSLVRRWVEEADFPIRYVWQENHGKPSAFNVGVAEAKGTLFLPLDSDDACIPRALERLLKHWNSIPAESQDLYSGVTVLCMKPDGEISGDRFREPVIDVCYPDLVAHRSGRGERWGFHRTDVLRQYPFPIFPGEKFVAEGVVWNRIARDYRLRLVDDPLRIYYPTPGLTSSLRRIRMQSPLSATLYYSEYLQLPIRGRERVKSIMNFLRYSIHAGSIHIGALDQVVDRMVAVLLLPVGLALAWQDRVLTAFQQ